MKIAIITLSDRCYSGQMQDTAGPAVEQLVRAWWPAAEVFRALLPDDEEAIVDALLELKRDGTALTLTVGGTGLGPRDRTPEATLRVVDRQAPGLAEAMRARSAERTPLAYLSRAVCGLAADMLIVNLPGSERGARESFTTLLDLLPHALDVISGGRSHPTV